MVAWSTSYGQPKDGRAFPNGPNHFLIILEWFESPNASHTGWPKPSSCHLKVAQVPLRIFFKKMILTRHIRHVAFVN
jgi:hypothetical protein